jgi:two-component system, chemotaxis family, sensor kinase CheA
VSSVLEQFITESRELIEAAGNLLLELERNATDTQRLDALFRAVHTIKGNSGLFDLPAFTRLVHSLEDRLDAVRQGSAMLGRDLIDASLEACDHMSRMVDEVESEGDISSDAAAIAAAMLARLRAAEPTSEAAAVEPESQEMDREDSSIADAWLVTYRPKADAFFCGEDPLYLVQSLPGLAHVEMECAGGQALGDDYDVFQANATFNALCHAPRDALDECFRYVPDEVEMRRVPTVDLDAAERQRLSALLCSQREAAKFALPGSGVHASVATVLTNVAERLQAPVRGFRADRSAHVLPLIELLLLMVDGNAAQQERGGTPAPSAPGKTATADASAARAESRYLKIDRARVDRLMELIGEMIVAKNGLPYVARRVEAGGTPRDLAREVMHQYASVSRIADEMQDAVMRMRMIPFSSALQRFPRLVRDIALRLGKEIELVIKGEETEADKTIIEGIGDPLLHIVRNSLDHGFELPQERVDAGKARRGTLTLDAHQEGDKVVVVVTDDGRGIDTARVLAKAVEKGLVSTSEAESMSHRDALQIIFRPGFSTAEQVSDLSGRGVGMDVVMRSIEQLRGTVDIDSTPGAGTVIRIALPLSIAVSHVMVTRCAGQLYGIPMDTVVETVRIAQSEIQRIREHRAAVLRGRIVPLFDLASVLQIDDRAQAGAATEHTELTALIVRTRNGIAGLVVDGFEGSMDVILKPMDGVLACLRGYAGTALLGNGAVLLVMNLEDLF